MIDGPVPKPATTTKQAAAPNPNPDPKDDAPTRRPPAPAPAPKANGSDRTSTEGDAPVKAGDVVAKRETTISGGVVGHASIRSDLKVKRVVGTTANEDAARRQAAELASRDRGTYGVVESHPNQPTPRMATTSPARYTVVELDSEVRQQARQVPDLSHMPPPNEPDRSERIVDNDPDDGRELVHIVDGDDLWTRGPIRSEGWPAPLGARPIELEWPDVGSAYASRRLDVGGLGDALTGAFWNVGELFRSDRR